MRITLLKLLIVPCLLAASACSLGNFNSVYRTPQLSDGRSLVLDAEQFVVLQIPRPNDGRVHTPATDHVVCVMPSPDALTAAAARGGLELDNPQGASGRIDIATMEAAASIGLRTQSIQLMRDAMFRMCEAYAAGGLDSLEYGIMMRRFQSRMVAVLAVEQLTGAITAAQPSISATAPNSPPQEAAREPESETSEPADPPADGASGKANHEHRPKPEEEPSRGEASDQAPAGGAQPTARTTPLGERDAAAAIAVAQTVEAITLAAMSTDYSSEICLDAVRYFDVEEQERLDLDRATPSGGTVLTPRQPAPRQFVDYCLRLIEAELQSRSDAQRVLIGAAQRIASRPGNLSSDDVTSIRRLLGQVDPAWQSADMRWLPSPYPSTPPNNDDARSEERRPNSQQQQQSPSRLQGGEGGREFQPMN